MKCNYHIKNPTFDEFIAAVKELLEPTAAGKGYNITGVDGPNELYDFVHGIAGGNGHALGEIIYKVRRYASKNDPKDIAKIAAWAFLIWRKHQCLVNTSAASEHPTQN
jgi:ABC-type glycerol-3-phosphate transport system substrate-binding protein